MHPTEISNGTGCHQLNEQSRESMKVNVPHTLQVIPVMMKSNEVLVVSQEDTAPNKPIQNHQCGVDSSK